MSLNNASARQDQRLRVGIQVAQGIRGLTHEQRRAGTVGACHISQSFNRVHCEESSCRLATVLVVITPSPDTVLQPLEGKSRPLHEWLTTFHLLSVVIDPYTNESAWVLKTARRVLAQFAGSSVRANYVVTADANDARSFLGPQADEALVFCDPDRTFVKQLGLTHLPAFVFLRIDGNVVASAQGWNPVEWRAVADEVARTVAWSKPLIPAPGDPGAFTGTPALV
jgi:hypothetical protein